MSAASGSSSGLFAAARNSAATLLTAGRTRLELLGNEIKEEKLRAVHLLLVSQLLAFCLALGTILGVALLVVLFWEQRAAVLGGFCVLFFAVAGVAYVGLQRAVRSPDRMFSASMAEFGADLSQLKAAARNESRTD